jgi:hypothetical protein
MATRIEANLSSYKVLVFIAQRYLCIGSAQHVKVTEQMSLSRDLTL